MRVLIACEFSGVVRDAFISKGHDAISCDLLPTESPGPHYQGDVFDIINDGWDMGICFPPCTFLSSVQTHLCRLDPNRVMDRIQGADFFMRLYNSKISKLALENPTGVMSHIFRPPDQIIHPYYFGDVVMKRTCLWLRGLPKLVHNKYATLFDEISTYNVVPPPSHTWIQKSSGKIKYLRQVNQPFLSGHERSRLSPFIAQAMADQWG